MIIKVKVIPNSKAEALQKLDTGSYKLKVKEKAIGGRANIAVISALALHFNVKKGSVKIIRGMASRDKVIEVASQ